MLSISVRVYGILKDSNNRVLVSDEFIRGNFYTKFPGGGLEIGEGTRDCLKREFQEETGLQVMVGDHIYTTDYFQVSAFNNAHQILSIYYYVHVAEPIALETKIKKFDFLPEQIADKTAQCEVFRWVEWNELNEDTVSLPIDKTLIKLLKKDENKPTPDETLLVRTFK